MITLSQMAQKLTQKQTQCTEVIEFTISLFTITICMGVQSTGKGELQPQLPKHPPLPQNVI